MPKNSPFGPLVPLADELWGSEYELRLSPGFYMPVRMTVIRGPAGLMLWSPGPIDDALAAALAELGEVSALVAPNLLHHLFIDSVQARYPSSKLYVAPGLAAKRADLRASGGLESLPPAWADELRWLTIDGAERLGEVVALHRRSQSLLVTDLLFNMGPVRGVLSPCILGLAGVYRRFAQSRLLRFLVDDRAAAGASVRAFLEWPIERLIPAHGAPVSGSEVKAEIASALHWMLRAS